jgi:hypothetical protein
MCNFFSCVSDGKGNIWYFDWEVRKKILNGELSYDPDSHASICDYYKLREDKCNKFEYNPLTEGFVVDMLNNIDDSIRVIKKVRKLDFSSVIPQLVVKPIHYPLNKKRSRISKKDVYNLEKWFEVESNSLRHIENNVCSSICDNVGLSLWLSVWDNFGHFMEDDIINNIWNSKIVTDGLFFMNIASSIKLILRAYMASFFIFNDWQNLRHKSGDNPFQCGIDLWDRSLIPSSDGVNWRLHSGPQADVVYEDII